MPGLHHIPPNGFGRLGRTSHSILDSDSMAGERSSTSSDASMYCKNYFGRVVKSREGIPYEYQRGCLAGHCPDTDCSEQCVDFRTILHDAGEAYALRPDKENTGSYKFLVNSSAVTNTYVEDGPVHHDRYWNRQFPKDYTRKKKAKRRQQKQARRRRHIY